MDECKKCQKNKLVSITIFFDYYGFLYKLFENITLSYYQSTSRKDDSNSHKISSLMFFIM